MMFKIKTPLLILLALIFVSGNIFVIYSISDKNKTISKYESIRKDSKNIINHFINREIIRIESENCVLSPQTLVFSLNGDSCYLADKCCTNPILVFRFSSQSCGMCIDKELERMEQNLMVEKVNVLIIASNKTVRELFLLKEYNSLGYEIHYIKENTLNIPIEKYNIPYFFILNTDGRIHSIFLPDMDNNDLSEQFYKTCNNLFTENF